MLPTNSIFRKLPHCGNFRMPKVGTAGVLLRCRDQPARSNHPRNACLARYPRHGSAAGPRLGGAVLGGPPTRTELERVRLTTVTTSRTRCLEHASIRFCRATPGDCSPNVTPDFDTFGFRVATSKYPGWIGPDSILLAKSAGHPEKTAVDQTPLAEPFLYRYSLPRRRLNHAICLSPTLFLFEIELGFTPSVEVRADGTQ